MADVLVANSETINVLTPAMRHKNRIVTVDLLNVLVLQDKSIILSSVRHDHR